MGSVAAILAYAVQAIQLIGALAKAGQDVSGIVQQVSSSLSAMQAQSRNPTDAEWAALDQLAAGLHAQLQAANASVATAGPAA